MDSRETIELLDAYPTSLTHLTNGEGEDIEIFANEFHAVIPPSEVNHRNCSEDKPCNGTGKGRYTLDSINRNAEPLSLSTAERFGELWDIHPEESEPDYDEPEETKDIPSIQPKVNVISEFQDSVPHVNTSNEQKDPIEIFQEREEYMKYGGWDGQESFAKIWNGDFEDISGSNPQGKAEMKLANYIGFFWGRNEDIIKYFMSTIPFESHYEQYGNHRKNLLEYATNVDWCYCEGVDFETKLTVAAEVWIEEEITVSKLADKIGLSGISEKQVRRVLDILEAEEVVEWTHGKVTNAGITHGYIFKLENICSKYKIEENQLEVSTDSIKKIEP